MMQIPIPPTLSRKKQTVNAFGTRYHAESSNPPNVLLQQGKLLGDPENPVEELLFPPSNARPWSYAENPFRVSNQERIWHQSGHLYPRSFGLTWHDTTHYNEIGSVSVKHFPFPLGIGSGAKYPNRSTLNDMLVNANLATRPKHIHQILLIYE
jgi:hypothetical protein